MIITKISNQTNFPVPIGHCIDWIHGSEKILTVALQCPTCNKAFCLANHVIDNEGKVSPSVVCPFSCGFHEFVEIK